MKVVVKNPNELMRVIEVSGLKEINKIVGNVDENGEGLNETGSDFRQGIFYGIDMHMNGAARINTDLPKNFYDMSGLRLYFGSVVFAGYDQNAEDPFGVCSLTDEQIEYLKENIRKVYDISNEIIYN